MSETEYQLVTNLHAVDGIIDAQWASGFKTGTEMFEHVNKVNFDYREVKIAHAVDLTRLGGLVVQCTRMVFRENKLASVRNLYDRINLNDPLPDPLVRLVPHKSVVAAAEKAGDNRLIEQLETTFIYPVQNDTWIFPAHALRVEDTKEE